MSETIRVLIADDHIHEREGFKQLLGLLNFVEVVGEATSAQNTVPQALGLMPDVILMDLTWFKDKTAGITAIQQIKAQEPTIKILAATVYPELIESARAAGADLAVDKDTLSNKTTLGDRIRDTYKSQTFTLSQPALTERLTERELEVLRFVAQGHTDAGIAEEIYLSVSTVKKHVSNILGKLGANNRSAAIALAYEGGILQTGTVQVE